MWLQGLKSKSWKQTNVSFEDFLVGNQGWCIKGQMLRKFIWYPKSIFRFIRPSMCISKRIKWIKKKSHREKIFFCIFFQSPYQVDMKNVVECPREFIAYFDALETTCVPWSPLYPRKSKSNVKKIPNHQICVRVFAGFSTFHYSRLRNKHRGTLINFWIFFRGLRPYSRE